VNVGVIGLGIMGSAMSASLMRAGYVMDQVVVGASTSWPLIATRH
jgi:3-hydroxyisobutyrate dehydrogenase-like beta-hydroxyacid dehydrogenase